VAVDAAGGEAYRRWITGIGRANRQMEGRVQVRRDGILRIEILLRNGVDVAAMGTIDLSPLHLRANGAPFLAPGQDELVLEALRGAGIEVPADAWLSIAEGYAFTLDEGGALVAELTATVEPPQAASTGTAR
jgi:hypothetical protein